VAYCPWNTSATTGHTVSIDFTDQSDGTKKASKDFVFHKGTADYSKGNTPVVLNFQHKFSKIRMTVGTEGPDLSTLEVKLNGMPQTATVDLAKLAVNPSDATAITTSGTASINAYVFDKSPTAATVEAIVAPYTMDAGNTIEFKIGSDTKTYTFENTFEFIAGMKHVLDFTLKKDVVTKTSDGMTNCYMVKPGEAVEFPVSRAYEHNGTNFTNKLRVANTVEYTSGFDAKVIWQDPSDLIESPTSTASAISGSGNTATVTVKAKNSKSGNAVIGIYKPGGTTPVWSYHIWVTSYTGAVTATNNGFVFMDRNLGATAAGSGLTARGLFYQWGRKNPFPGAKDGTAGYAERAKFYGINDPGFNSAQVKVTGTDNASCLIQSIQNPTTFFTNYDATNYDWLKTLKDDLWNIRENSEDIKTIYDPCPSGWRVPAHKDNTTNNDNTPWRGYSGSNNTWGDTGAHTFGINAVYPATGMRLYERGTATNEGFGGYVWSGSPGGATAPSRSALMIYYYNVISPNNVTYRSSACSVRCVQE
jgi:hypothetical protein